MSEPTVTVELTREQLREKEMMQPNPIKWNIYNFQDVYRHDIEHSKVPFCRELNCVPVAELERKEGK